MENKVYLGLGSNKGDRLGNLRKGIEMLNSLPGCIVEKCSFVYETEPCGGIEQSNFYNAVCLVSTSLNPAELLAALKEIERKGGRVKSERWGPREIDIDILLYNDLNCTDETLTVPHKEMLKRDFVLVPLLELDPEIAHPVLKVKLSGIEPEGHYIINRIEENLLKTVGG